VFGDSYTTPGVCVEPCDSVWGLMSQDLSVDCIENYSHSGFSLDHVVHILLNETFDFEQDFFVVGIPPLIRTMIYDDNCKTTWNYTSFDCDFSTTQHQVESLQNTNRYVLTDQFFDRSKVDRYNAGWNDVQCLEKIYLLHQYFQSKQAKFVMLNFSNPVDYQDLWPAGKSIMIKTKQLKECILFDNTCQLINQVDQIKPVDFDQYGWQGHHGAEGNRNWYNKIVKPKMIELNWINNA